MAVYVTGDLHGGRDMHKLSAKVLRNQNIDIGEGDYLVVLGDFGFPFFDSEAVEKRGEYTYWINWLAEKPYTVLWVDGNHENFNFWDAQPVTEWHGGKVQIHPKADNVIHLMRGEIYDIEGKRYFAFGGAASHDKGHRKEDYSWWKQEIATDAEIENARNNLEKAGYEVDYILTHTPPSHIISRMTFISQVPDKTADFLTEVVGTVDYSLFLSGHVHRETLFARDRFASIYQKVYGIEELEQLFEQVKDYSDLSTIFPLNHNEKMKHIASYSSYIER